MVAPEDLECLKRIALMGGTSTPVFLKTLSLGSELGFSPQTASRRLRSLEQQELITRVLGTDGQQVTITGDGEDERAGILRLLSVVRAAGKDTGTGRDCSVRSW